MNTLIPKSNPKSRERVDPPVPPGAATANMGKDLRSRVGAARGMLTFAPFPFFFLSWPFSWSSSFSFLHVLRSETTRYGVTISDGGISHGFMVFLFVVREVPDADEIHLVR